MKKEIVRHKIEGAIDVDFSTIENETEVQFAKRFFPDEFILNEGKEFYVFLQQFDEKDWRTKRAKLVPGKIYFPFGLIKRENQSGYYVTFIPNGLHIASIWGKGTIKSIKVMSDYFLQEFGKDFVCDGISPEMVEFVRQLFFDLHWENVNTLR
jgi:hypothetical protein